MQSPRGSNNRANEKSANRNNANRMFNSQNNNRGGYNIADLQSAAFAEGTTTNADSTLFGNGLDRGQYSEMYFEGSEFVVEWTHQHGCGGNEQSKPNKLNCNLVLQMGCHTDNTKADPTAGKPALMTELQMDLKNGRNTNTPDTADSKAEFTTQHTTNDANGRGRHEHEAWYYQCSKVYRNKGLFLADQNLKGDSLQYTRQNPNGNRNGLECPEERDYYPYWHPTPWMDVAILTDNVQDCDSRFNYKANSQNVKAKWACDGTSDDCYKYYDNMTTCAAMGCTPKSYSHGIPAPRCEQAPWTRANSLGNGVDGRPTTINITLPLLVDTSVGYYTKIATLPSQEKVAKCVLRIRYNISTDDYDPANTTAANNQYLNAQPTPIVSPVTQNPTVDIGLDSLQGLRLAINTNQFGRTFQDRSHTWYLMSKPPSVPASSKIYEMIVRGKRGNIVQTFPAVEYDFVPKRLHVEAKDFVHLQWSGSNTHNNGNPAGDGQAGDAGEGTGGTDRHNVVPFKDTAGNYPIPFYSSDPAKRAEFKKANMFMNSKCWRPKDAPVTGATEEDSSITWGSNTFEEVTDDRECALLFASAGYYRSMGEMATKTKLSVLLNNGPASFAKGGMLQMTAGKYEFMCTRNNNFSNRSQKGVINVA